MVQSVTKSRNPMIKGRMAPPEPLGYTFGTKVTLLTKDRDLFLSDEPRDFNRFLTLMENETVKWDRREVQARSGSPADDPKAPDSRLLLWKIKATDKATGETIWDNNGDNFKLGREIEDIPKEEDLLARLRNKKAIKKVLEKGDDVDISLLPAIEEKTLVKLDKNGNPVYWKKGEYVDRTVWRKVPVKMPLSNKTRLIKDVVLQTVNYKEISRDTKLLKNFEAFLAKRNRRIGDYVIPGHKKIEEAAPFICALDQDPQIRLMGPVDLMRPLAKAIIALIDGDVKTLNKIIDERKTVGRLNNFPYYLPRTGVTDEEEGHVKGNAVSVSRLFVNKAERDPDGKFCSDTLRVYINPERVDKETESKVMTNVKPFLNVGDERTKAEE